MSIDRVKAMVVFEEAHGAVTGTASFWRLGIGKRSVDELYAIIDKNTKVMSDLFFAAMQELGQSKPDRTFAVVEVCPHCEREVEIRGWNTDTDGFKAFCPYCGKRLMLCDECRHIGNGDCDYNGGTDTCQHNQHSQRKANSLYAFLCDEVPFRIFELLEVSEDEVARDSPVIAEIIDTIYDKELDCIFDYEGFDSVLIDELKKRGISCGN